MINLGLPCTCETALDLTDSPCNCHYQILFHFTSYLFFLYHFQDDECEIINRISDKIHEVFSHHPSANICVFEDFNIHHLPWPLYCNWTDGPGIECIIIFYVDDYDLTQAVTPPTCVSDAQVQVFSFLGLYPTSCVIMKPVPLDDPFDHCVISAILSFCLQNHFTEHHFIVLFIDIHKKTGITVILILHVSPVQHFFNLWLNKMDGLNDAYQIL